MGVLRASIARLALSLAGILLSTLTSIITVRRLEPRDYGLYSLATRRLTMLARSVYRLVSYWYTRRADAAIVAGFISTALIIAPPVALSAAVLALLAGASLPEALGLGAMTTMLVAMGEVLSVYTAYRYVRSAALRLAYRAAYASLIILLVQVARLSLWGVIVSSLVASTLVILLVAREVGLKRPLLDWAKPEKIRVPLLSVLAGLAAPLDYLVVVAAAGPAALAVYSVSLLAPMMLVEVVGQAATHTTPYIVETGDLRSTIRTYKLLALLAAPLLGFIASHPLLVTSILNPRYATIAAPLVVLVALLYAPLAISIRFNALYAPAYGRELSESKRLVVFYASRSMVPPSSAAAAAILIHTGVPAPLALFSARIGAMTAELVSGAMVAPGVERIALHAGLETLLYAALSALVTLHLHPDRLHPSIWPALLDAASAAPSLAVSYAALLLDPDVRLVAGRAARLLTSSRRRV